jgi:hypothetical protein
MKEHVMVSSRIHEEMHDAYITDIQVLNGDLILAISWTEWSMEKQVAVETRRTRLIFSGLEDIDAGKMRGRLWFIGKPQLYKTVVDLLALPSKYTDLQTPIDYIEPLADGFVLNTHVVGEYHIKAQNQPLGRVDGGLRAFNRV